MNRTFLVAAIVLFPTHATAAKIQLEFESQFHFTDWQIATRDSANHLITINVSDADGDGMASAMGDFELTTFRPDIFGMPMMDDPILLCANGEAGSNKVTIPLFHTIGGNPVAAVAIGPPTSAFTLGQVVDVVDGQVTNFNGSLHQDPGIMSAVALANTNVGALPTYTGQAAVVALYSAVVIAEPLSHRLLLIGCVVTLFARRRR